MALKNCPVFGNPIIPKVGNKNKKGCFQEKFLVLSCLIRNTIKTVIL